MKVHLALAAVLALTIGAASLAPVYAMGDGDSGSSTPKKCKKGEVLKKGKCVKATSGVLPD